MTRGRLLDRIRLALAGGFAVRTALGEETNFTAAGEGRGGGRGGRGGEGRGGEGKGVVAYYSSSCSFTHPTRAHHTSHTPAVYTTSLHFTVPILAKTPLN